MAHLNVDWETCANHGCIGVRLATGDACWAHAAGSDLESALKQLGEHGHLDARGVPITQELLGRLLAAAPRDDHGHAVLTDARFERAIFHDDAKFGHTTIKGFAWFDQATFQGKVLFLEANLLDARFDEATFQGNASFMMTTFGVDARFDQATFQREANFIEATFRSKARFSEATFKGTAWFMKATFQGFAWFMGATFQGEARFDEATFQGEARFDEATFQRDARFNEVTFQGMVWFLKATLGDVWFDHATFQRSPVGFDQAIFQRDASFISTNFRGVTMFVEATFHGHAFFARATFQRDARFERASFHRDVWFPETVFQRMARFRGATFQHAQQLGPMLVRKSLVFDGAIFHERAQIEVAAAAVCCQRTRFLAGVQLRVHWAQVVLDGADLAAPSILAGTPAFQSLEEGHWGRWVRALARLAIGADAGRPRLVSVRRADVAGLTVAGVDLRACRFAGAHHLDQLRTEESDFASTPRGWRWTTRQTIAEEHHWRAARLHPNGEDIGPAAVKPRTVTDGAGWYHSAHWPPAWLDVEPPTPAQIAVLYRALRKGREDSKDEPGAADFYYGEMEMRRHDPTKPRAERLVLFLYWLFSGYALRASRALVWLLGVLAVASVLLAAVGLEQPTTAVDWSFPARLGTAALVAVEGAVFRASEQQLTYVGRLIQATLRFAGPVLLGLAVLSIRGRVKR